MDAQTFAFREILKFLSVTKSKSLGAWFRFSAAAIARDAKRGGRFGRGKEKIPRKEPYPEIVRHAVIDCFKYTAGSPLSP
jgi:hypothetical protein